MTNRRILEVKSDRSMTDQGSRHSVKIEEMSLAGPLLSNTPGTVPHDWNTTCGNRVSRNLRLLTFPFFASHDPVINHGKQNFLANASQSVYIFAKKLKRTCLIRYLATENSISNGTRYYRFDRISIFLSTLLTDQHRSMDL